MNQNLKVLSISAEIFPFTKYGEQTEVADSLPKSLSPLENGDMKLFFLGILQKDMRNSGKKLQS